MGAEVTLYRTRLALSDLISRLHDEHADPALIAEVKRIERIALGDEDEHDSWPCLLP